MQKIPTIRELIDNKLIPTLDEKRKDFYCEFLKEQDLSSVDQAVMSFKLVDELYNYCDSRYIELELMFDKNIKIGQKEITTTLTFEQVQELKMMNVNMVDATQNAMLMELTREIIDEFSSKKKIYLNTNRSFFEYKTSVIAKPEHLNSPYTKIKMTAHCKVLTVKDFRRLKLDEIEKE